MLPSPLPYSPSPVHDAVLAVQLLPSFLSALPGPNHIQATGDHESSARGSISQSQWLILWQWRLFHPVMWWLTKSSGTSLACRIYILILLCGTFWSSVMLALQFGSGILLRMCVWARGWGCPVGSSVWFVTGYVSFPVPPLFSFLEAAQRCVITSGECYVQELTVRQGHCHHLHRRGESPPARRSGPLSGNCTWGGALKCFCFCFF